MKIAFFCRSLNYALYARSLASIKLDYPKYRFRFSDADGYFYRMLKSDADIAVNIDEDAFVCDNRQLAELLEFFLDGHYVNCGMPDGGVVPTKHDNPVVTNAFFNILDLRAIRKDFSFGRLKKYRIWNPEWEKLAPLELLKTPYQFNMAEPYYPFFLYLADNFKTLYLNAVTHQDGISTCLLNQNQKPFVCHSWFSREYGVDLYHTQRINALFAECVADLTVPQWRIAFRQCWEKILFKIFYRSYWRGKLLSHAVRKRIDFFRQRN